MNTMNLNRIVNLILCFILALAACQPSASPADVPAPVSEATQEMATETAVTEADVPEPTLIPPQPMPPLPTDLSNPRIQVTGDLTASVEADNYYVAPVKAEDESIIGTMLYLNQEDTRIVFIRFPKDAAPGTYPVTQGYTENFDGTEATGNYIDQTSDPASHFTATGGTLTLVTTGDSYSGAFEFTAVGVEGTPLQGKSVTVSGAFADIEAP